MFSEWFKRMRVKGTFVDMMECRFQVAMKPYGLDQKVAKLRTDLFSPLIFKGSNLLVFVFTSLPCPFASPHSFY